MEILTPPRIATLEPQPIQVIQHDTYTSTTKYVLENVYPFETLFSLKQRIALHNNDDKTWLPSQVFIASSTENGVYEPIEFAWPFKSTQLTDPLQPESVGKPDPRIWADNSRKPVFPVILSGITLEIAIPETPRTIHVWNLHKVANAAGFGAQTLPTESVFQGFLQLYFPLIDSEDTLQQALQPLSSDDREIFQAARLYRTQVDARLSRLETAIRSEAIQSARPLSLTELRYAKFRLPDKAKFNTGVLELRFYELNPSESVPFIRYFPARNRTPPLVKLAVTATGVPMIDDKRVLELFLADQPDATDGAIIVFKSPIVDRRAPLGTHWTLHIYETGKAYLEIIAPRKDTPLSTAVVVKAMELLPNFLAGTPWKDAATPEIDELQATYEFTTIRPGVKPSRGELNKRIDIFLPMVEGNIDIEEGDTAALALRYKALSNFKHDTDPIKRFITTLYQNKAISSEDDVPLGEFAKRLGDEFGISRAQAGAYIADWIRRDADGIEVDKKTIPLTNTGSLIKLYNSHPKYVFQLNNIESQKDLSRIATLMTVYVTLSSAELRSAPVQESAQVAEMLDAVEASKEDDQPIEELDAAELAMMGLDDVSPPNQVTEAQNAAPLPPLPPLQEEAAHETTTLVAPDEVTQAIGDSWYLKRLGNYDPELFNYTKKKDDPRVTPYSRTCQKSSEKQPHVMPPETYQRARQEYQKDVFWVEAPLTKWDLEAVVTASKAVGERGKNQDHTDYKDLVALEKRALALGFSLKEKKSVTDEDKKDKEDLKAQKAIDRAIITDLSNAQFFDTEGKDRKPLWTVLRLGTNTERPNYYVCVEWWCVREDMPLLERDFMGTTMRNGRQKPAQSCPFCTGRLITDKVTPKPGETVLQREPATTSGPIAKYVGFQKKLYHPDKFALPCCFVSPDDLEKPADAMPLPPVKVPLPDIQLEADAPALAPVRPAVLPRNPATDVFRDRPFSPNRGVKKDKDGKDTSPANGFYIPNQNILGRSTEDWFELERGTVAVPPNSVNALLSQDPEKFLTVIKGVMAESQNSYLMPYRPRKKQDVHDTAVETPAHAFVRYGLGGNVREPGANLLALIAFANYAIKSRDVADPTVSIASNEEIFTMMFDTKGPEMLHAFEQANYGTLVHEFSTDKAPNVSFDTWFQIFFPGAPRAQKPYAEVLFRAWHNFKDYVNDYTAPKELRYWESLFATPGLLTETGFILVKIVYPKGKDKPAVIQCPEFGVSQANLAKNLPLLFVLEDSVTGLYDPLVFYEGKSFTEKLLLGVLQADTHAFNKLSETVKGPLQAFFKNYFTPVHGCGREAVPVHPWVLETEQEGDAGMPTLGELNARIGETDMHVDGLLRDLTNRCVGIYAKWDGKHIYLPCRDDGTILKDVTSLHGSEALPRPDIESLFKMLVGAPRIPGKQKIVKFFPGYEPALLVASATHYEGVQMRCGAIVPIESHLRTTEIPQKWFVEMKKGEMYVDMPDKMQWETDMTLLKPGPKQTLEQTKEEHLEEAYQHVRISFSNWLTTHKDGAKVLKQLNLLRDARKRLPLYELQKRLEILLTSIILNPKLPWLTEAGPAGSSVLRRDCLQIEKEDACTAGCAWNTDTSKCLIHVTKSDRKTQRHVDPKRILVVRLADELLRSFGYAQEILEQRVPYLKPLGSETVIREGDSVLLSISGKGDATTYEKLGYMGRNPTSYTQGDTYPEELNIDMETPADWLQTLQYYAVQLKPDVYRDPTAMLVSTLVMITQKSVADLARDLRIPAFNGSQEDWKRLAQHYKTEILFTRPNQPTRTVVVDMWIGSNAAPTVQRKFIIIDPEGIPFQRQKDKSFVIPEAELPSSIQRWVEAHSAV